MSRKYARFLNVKYICTYNYFVVLLKFELGKVSIK